MKQRLDIQSLLEDSQKEDLVRFLKSCFARNTTLADEFLIHFASTFQLDESEFHLITDRIDRMFPGNLSALTHKKANEIRNHLTDLLEQTRDCQSRTDFRQAFLIVSHLMWLLDRYIGRISDKYQFMPVYQRSFKILDSIYRESPAPSLKSRMRLFLQELITHGRAIPFDEGLNPYVMLLDWVKDSPKSMGLSLLKSLQDKAGQYPKYQKLWLYQRVKILVTLEMDKELLKLLAESGDDSTVYEALFRYLDTQELQDGLLGSLRSQYETQNTREVKYQIYQILRRQNTDVSWFIGLAVQEYFHSGDLAILEDLLKRDQVEEQDVIGCLIEFEEDNPRAESFYLYSAYKYLARHDLLMEYLLKEHDIFEILPFLEIVYPRYREEMEDKLAGLMETYLRTHFGRPAINHINGILDEISRLGHYGLISYLLQRIRQKFGHRKHFQKLMKELVQ